MASVVFSVYVQYDFTGCTQYITAICLMILPYYAMVPHLIVNKCLSEDLCHLSSWVNQSRVKSNI